MTKVSEEKPRKNPEKQANGIGYGFCENCHKDKIEIRKSKIFSETFWICKECADAGSLAGEVQWSNWEE
jgi:hypothetical protein